MKSKACLNAWIVQSQLFLGRQSWLDTFKTRLHLRDAGLYTQNWRHWAAWMSTVGKSRLRLTATRNLVYCTQNKWAFYNTLCCEGELCFQIFLPLWHCHLQFLHGFVIIIKWVKNIPLLYLLKNINDVFWIPSSLGQMTRSGFFSSVERT